MPSPKKAITARSLLNEVDEILQKGKYYQSRESGKRFYDQHDLSKKLASYIVQSGNPIKTHAARFGMSSGSLKSIIEGGRLSDNMLMRIRSSLVQEVESKSVFPGDWHEVSPAKVSAAISIVSDKLVFLKKVIESNNFLQSESSPIDKIQVAQLVALLTATLEALRAPYVDKEQTKGFFRWLAKFARKSAEKGAEKIVTDAMSDAVTAGTDLIQELSKQSSTPDLGTMI